MTILAVTLLILAGIPFIMTFANAAALRSPPLCPGGVRVAILIPARDEESGIVSCVECALASTTVALEVIVLDDHSTDATAALVRRLAADDSRLRLFSAPALPPGWSGKVHACHVLAGLTDAPNLIFVDADVRLEPDAAARLVEALAGADLISGVPRQRMESLAEMLIIPMINTLLLGYLPIALSRRDPRPALAAACGQMIAVRSSAYAKAGGHAGVCASLHDGLALPRLFRSVGLRTDLVAGTRLASVRMYVGWRAVIAGTSKNATEGMAKPFGLPVWTVLLLGGHVLPWAFLVYAIAWGRPILAVAGALACVLPLIARLRQTFSCREPLTSVPLHPFGVIFLLALQWLALARKWVGRPQTWRGRSYPAKG